MKAKIQTSTNSQMPAQFWILTPLGWGNQLTFSLKEEKANTILDYLYHSQLTSKRKTTWPATQNRLMSSTCPVSESLQTPFQDFNGTKWFSHNIFWAKRIIQNMIIIMMRLHLLLKIRCTQPYPCTSLRPVWLFLSDFLFCTYPFSNQVIFCNFGAVLHRN